MNLSAYVVGQGDSIDILAQQLLGDFRLSDTLIRINNLRYPYISDNPADQFANLKGMVTLSASYTNASTVQISNANSVSILPGDTLFFSEGSATAIGVVDNITGTTITFAQQITGAFDQAALVYVFQNQQNIRSQVLKTGDTLFYPTDQTETGSSQSYSFLFGTDWALDSSGFLVRSGQDMSTVTGLDNLSQAVRNRFITSKGSLMLHPDYGNQLQSLLGESGTPYFRGLSKHYAQQCILQDQRIANAEIQSISVSQDAISFQASIHPIGIQNSVIQNVTLPIGGS